VNKTESAVKTTKDIFAGMVDVWQVAPVT